MIKLRDYQQKIVSSLRTSIGTGNKKVLIHAPTGAG